MKYCNMCGEEVNKNVKFCGKCGASQSENKSSNALDKNINDSALKILDEFSSRNENGNLFKIFGWISFVISLLYFPIIFGAVAVVMGYLYRSYDEKHGTVLMIMGVAGGLFGMLLGLSTGGY
ncbi:zinc-ribbon domain-containing protein [Carnobacterium maltaromaticum]|uniref:zinc-ribbon domain-containing protein n=1 Tax=Carnobacterium maltaromaticum TaxID=2751 RepID=UPI00295F2BEB|nr:zinc-ribbon domain-containing protein [Carnobacterium maltaromaticum]